MATVEALAAWGSYDLDDPFPLFAALRELVRSIGPRWRMDTTPG